MEISFKTLTDLYDSFFGDYTQSKDVVCGLTFEQLRQDEQFYVPYGVTLNNINNGFYALALYRLTNNFLLNNNGQFEELINKIKSYSLNNFLGYISPLANIEIGVVFLGNVFEIGKNTTIKQNTIINNNVFINVNKLVNNDNNNIVIDKNCNVGNNVNITGKTTIGAQVNVCDNAIIRENIEANTNVEIVNQLLLKHGTKSVLPSQKLTIYGLTKKYKNTIIIYGEGFYNPKVIVRDKDKKEVLSELMYWDKNKIMLKFKYVKYKEQQVKGAVLVVMSNGSKITLLNNFALESLLKNLCE